MATGDDDADRFRVPRWISDGNSEDESFVAGPRMPSLNAGEPLWPAAADREDLPGPPAAGDDWWPAVDPPKRGRRAGPPGARKHAGPPGAGVHAGPPGAGMHAGPPGAGMHAGPRGAGKDDESPGAGMPGMPDRAPAGSLPPPVTKGQRQAAEPQRRRLLLVVTAAALVVIVAVGLLVKGATGGDKTPTAGSVRTTAGPASPPGQPGSNASPSPNNAFGPLTIEAES